MNIETGGSFPFISKQEELYSLSQFLDIVANRLKDQYSTAALSYRNYNSLLQSGMLYKNF